VKEIAMKTLFFALSILLPATPALAGKAADEHHHAVTMPKQFDTLKQLLGTWEGKSDMGQGEQNMQVVYELTSGGTAIIETLMKGTPQEMVSVYHKEGDSLGMTHYCSMGNQPHMKLKQADDKHMMFEMDKPQGITSSDEAHMHALTLTLKDKNTLQHDWINYQDGKPAQTFLLHKKS
jgi:hypothetical protein